MAISTCDCFNHRDEWPEGYDVNRSGCKFPKVTYEGAVLAEWERNMHDDSDFKAAVWDEETQTVRSITWGTTRGWTYHNGCKVDATDEVKAKAARWYANKAYERAVWKAEETAVNPTVGKSIRSTTTRGKNKGVVGTIVKREVDPYKGPYYKNGYKDPESIYYQRVLVQVWGEQVNDKEADMSFINYYETGDERLALRWMAADRVEVIDAEPIDYEKLRKQADTLTEHPDQLHYQTVFDIAWVM